MHYLWIAIGSALGGSRFALSQSLASATFPWGTLSVNILGCFLIGIFAATLEAQPWRQFLMIGLCGGFTTFSSFSLETINLLRDGQPLRAGAYIAASVLLCLLAAWAGHGIGHAS